jgi:hypothetical protein
MARLYIFPEALALEVLARLHWVDGPFPLASEFEKFDSANKD